MNDKQFTDELFKRMYDLGYRKAEIEDDTLFFFVDKRDYLRLFTPRVPVKCTCFDEKNQLINVGEYLGVVDWSKVAVDTLVLVSNDNKEWTKRYFAKYEDGNVYCWLNGRTSWTALCEFSIGHWGYTKLAEV